MSESLCSAQPLSARLAVPTPLPTLPSPPDLPSPYSSFRGQNGKYHNSYMSSININPCTVYISSQKRGHDVIRPRFCDVGRRSAVVLTRKLEYLTSIGENMDHLPIVQEHRGTSYRVYHLSPRPTSSLIIRPAYLSPQVRHLLNAMLVVLFFRVMEGRSMVSLSLFLFHISHVFLFTKLQLLLNVSFSPLWAPKNEF